MDHVWPTPLDLVVTITYLALIVIVPGLGYVFMVLDYRAYVRSLKRGLVRVGSYVGGTPDWARAETPRAIAALGLRVPCTEEDLKHAYRKRVKKLHPDQGGDERRFLQLQAHFEEALAIVSGYSPSGYPR